MKIPAKNKLNKTKPKKKKIAFMAKHINEDALNVRAIRFVLVRAKLKL